MVKLLSFVALASLALFVCAEQPLVADFSQDTAPEIFGNHEVPYLLYFASAEGDDWKDSSDLLTEAAKPLEGKLRFVRMNTADAENERMLDFFKVEKNELPALRIIDLRTRGDVLRYKPEANGVSRESLDAFTSAYLDGKVPRDFASEKTPEDWNQNPVWVLTGNNVGEVIPKQKNVFVMFYAPWCGHCKALHPTWELLGEHYKDNQDIVIAKLDATANEHEMIDVHGFPTLRLYSEGKHQDYNSGERSLEALKKFVDFRLNGGAIGTYRPDSSKESKPEEEEEGEDEEEEGTDEDFEEPKKHEEAKEAQEEDDGSETHEEL